MHQNLASFLLIAVMFLSICRIIFRGGWYGASWYATKRSVLVHVPIIAIIAAALSCWTPLLVYIVIVAVIGFMCWSLDYDRIEQQALLEVLQTLRMTLWQMKD
jgi:hypothetical protein